MSTWVIVNESSKRTWIRTRRILSRYLLQIGNSTWSGFLTTKAADNLRTELNALRNKNMSIAWYRCEKNRMLLEYVQGKNVWHPHLGYAFRTKTIPTMLTTTPIESLERTVLQMSALAHDLGKASINFQKMLQSKGEQSEPVRHEFLSFLLLIHVGFEGNIKNQSPMDILDRWSNNQYWNTIDLSKYAGSRDRLLRTVKEWFIAFEQWNEKKHGYVVHWIIMLVLTHHRLIDGHMEVNRKEEWIFNPELQSMELKKHFVRRDTNASDFAFVQNATTPWNHAGWMGAWQSLCLKLKKLLTTVQLEPSEWSKLAYSATHNMRPWLILSDYLASSKKENTNLDYDTTVIANTIIDTHGNMVAADSLVQHLRKTRTCAKEWIHTLKTTNWPTLQIHECTKSGLLRTQSSGKFQWQQDSLQEIPVNIKHAFTVVLADTGSGKTAFSMKLMERLASNVRVSYAVGLTTLTEQTSTSFKNALGIPAHQILTVVGAQEKIDETIRARARNNYSVGTFNDITDETSKDVNTSRKTVFLEEYNTHVQQFLGHEIANRALNTPILVCTADYLVHAATAEHGEHLPWIPRICTAGLILDEIDNYAGKEINGLCKLVTMAASHGMPVICMSATIRPSMVQALYRAWKYGHDIFNLRTGIKNDAYVGFINNVHTMHMQYTSALQELPWDTFIDQLLMKKEANTKQRFDILDIPEEHKTGYGYYDFLFEKANALANVHLTTIQGFSLSTGFIRMNTVRDAREFARHLIAKIDNGELTNIAVICYHARFPIVHLAEIETKLTQWVDRSGKDDDWTNRPLIRKSINQWKKTGHTNGLFLVITTSIEETGRDHDFDFCISEPANDRSIIQAAGRVLRHRSKNVEQPNVLLINHFQRTPWMNPGFKNDTIIKNREELLEVGSTGLTTSVSKKAYSTWNDFFTHTKQSIKFNITENVHVMSPLEAFPIQEWKHVFDSRCCWKINPYNESPTLGIMLGHFISYGYTDGIAKRNNSQIGFKQWLKFSDARWSRHHNRQTRFRESNTENGDFVIEIDEHENIKIRLWRYTINRDYEPTLLRQETKPSQFEIRIERPARHNPLDIEWSNLVYSKKSKKLRQISWNLYDFGIGYDYRPDLGLDKYR